MTTKEGQEIKEDKVETIQPPPETPKPPTAEEQMATLQKQMDEIKQKYEQADKGLRSAQATLTQKDRLLKEKENLNLRIDSLEESMQILAGLIAKGNINPEEVEGYKKEFDNLKQKRQQEEQQVALKTKQDEYNQTANAIWDRAQKVITDKKDLKMIELLLLNGKPNDAEELVAEKEMKPVDNKPTDEQKKIEELTKEIERLKKVASGELNVEKGLPSGASANEAQIRKNFRENPNNPKARADYLELQRKK